MTLRQEMIDRANGGRTVPQVFIDGTHIGGYDELAELERAAKLDPLLAAIEALANAFRRMTLPSDRSFRAALVQLRSGRSIAPNWKWPRR